MYHSIIISGDNTYEKWGLIPTERPVVSPPQVKSSFIELPSSNASIDSTEFLTGEPHYGQSTGTWAFYFDPDLAISQVDPYRTMARKGTLWAKVYSSLLNSVHGKTHKIIFEDEPNKIYTGRLVVNQWQSGKPFSTVSISYNIDLEVGEIVDD